MTKKICNLLERNSDIIYYISYILVMDVAQYILCFMARYVNISCRRRTVTMFSTSSAFETHISYKMHCVYAKCDILQDLMSLSMYPSYPQSENVQKVQ